MSQKPIREYDGKRLINNWFLKHGVNPLFETLGKMLFINPEIDIERLEDPFRPNERLVVKPDQLIKRRGKLGLVGLNLTFNEVREWLIERRGSSLTVKEATDSLDYFLVEEFVSHEDSEEQYICIKSSRDGDEILFCDEGGVDVGDVDSKAKRFFVPIGEKPKPIMVINTLLQKLPKIKQGLVAEFICTLFSLYCDLHFAYLEINPLVVKNDGSGIYILDLAAKLDTTAEFVCHAAWDGIQFPPYFGHKASDEEVYVSELDERTGASLKLTVINPKARIWTMVAGGGASVIYADTVADLGSANELGNYGEYSGAPTQSLTYQYAITIIDLLLKYDHPKGKILLIGGGIANFTDVADTFKGIIQALKEKSKELKEKRTKIYVRRGGPNYQRGLKLMRQCGEECQLDMKVFGPEEHIVSIVSMALSSSSNNDDEKNMLNDANVEAYIETLDLSKYYWNKTIEEGQQILNEKLNTKMNSFSFPSYKMTNNTRAIVYGMQTRAVQNMLDFDYISSRKERSVAAIVYTFASGIYYRQFYWGSKEIMIPVYKSLDDALKQFPEVDTIVNFASSRSAYNATREMLEFSQIKHITIIAEGVPERHTKELIRLSKEKNVIILGPSTVGGLKPGSFRIGNTGGMLDNIVSTKLYRPGSVAFVSRSGGLSNELSNIISRYTDGVLEGMAIGGDRYPISTFMDNLLRYQCDPKCKILILLGEVGGTLEYEIVSALKNGLITKPIIAWCTGTCAKCFPYEVQFGHAGALAQSQLETASSKNKALSQAGCIVPDSFNNFGRLIQYLYQRLLQNNIIKPNKEIEPPPIPIDYSWARKMGMVRKPSGFLSGISDERGEELVYAGMPISQVFSQNLGIGGVVGLLWFRKKLPNYFNQFIEIILMVTADHGPAVSGAHNTIVTARAGKDLISSLCSGLLTIGPRFGGALDSAARMFAQAHDSGLSPQEFVVQTRKNKQLIMGIGHKVKSLENPDKRVEIVVEFAKKHFPNTTMLDYGLEVQKITTRKKSNLILNVDGAIACAFVDLLKGSPQFSKQEADQYIQNGVLNGLFVLGRSIGFIGHFLDQKRLGQGLYRHPTDDITYFLHDLPSFDE